MQTLKRSLQPVSVVIFYTAQKNMIRRATYRMLLVFLLLGLVLNFDIQPVNAAVELEITPLTWNTVGIGDPNPSLGPNVFPVGARVCNTGDAAATDLTVTFRWETTSENIDLAGPGSFTSPSLAANSCRDFYFYVRIVRSAGSAEAAREYVIEAESSQAGPVTTDSPREIYVERLSPSTNLTTLSIEGPTQVVVGQMVDYIVESTLAVDFYQVVHFLNFPPERFRLAAVQTNYGSHPNLDHDQLYANACGWQEDPIHSNYRTCKGPPTFPGGTVSGSVNTTYTVEVLSAGSAEITNILYGYHGQSYFYNEDIGQTSLTITAQNPIPTQTPTNTTEPTSGAYLPAILKGQTTPSPSPTITPTLTFTPTPTLTGTIRPAITAGKTPTGTNQLRVNNELTFTIRVINGGTAPAENVVLRDNLTAYTYLNITNLETTKGTRNIDGRVATVTIGTVMPNEIVTVTLTVRVATAPTTNQNPCNFAAISFGTTVTSTVNSNQSCFSVLGGAVLPGTGERVDFLEAGETSSFNWWTAALALLVAALILAGWNAARQRNRKAVYFISGVLLITAVIGLIFFNQNEGSRQPGPQISANIDLTSISTQAPSSTSTPNPFSVHPTYEFSELEIIETLPAFPIPSPTPAATTSPGEPEPDTSPVRRIRIPSLELDTVVAFVPFDGQTWLIKGLREEIAWMGDTSWPGLGGNTGLAGHVTVRGLGKGPFWKLDSLKYGDTITLHTEENTYTYFVRDQRIVEEWDLTVIEPTEDPQITLITCIEWSDAHQVYLKRLVVFANLVQVEPLRTSRGY
jgi:LPXTG-site transpeptidase (sortase) family protein